MFWIFPGPSRMSEVSDNLHLESEELIYCWTPWHLPYMFRKCCRFLKQPPIQIPQGKHSQGYCSPWMREHQSALRMLFHPESLENSLALCRLRPGPILESFALQHCLAFIGDYEEDFTLWLCCPEIARMTAEPLCLDSASILINKSSVWDRMCHRTFRGSWPGTAKY